mmetsp:Transcript_15051/g.52840  ORF Transcript_15051/g.52840 Transcript_15051/m.52840 type:complete len:273 (+) Transcript_15051:496-1314(+)
MQERRTLGTVQSRCLRLLVSRVAHHRALHPELLDACLLRIDDLPRCVSGMPATSGLFDQYVLGVLVLLEPFPPPHRLPKHFEGFVPVQQQCRGVCLLVSRAVRSSPAGSTSMCSFSTRTFLLVLLVLVLLLLVPRSASAENGHIPCRCLALAGPLVDGVQQQAYLLVPPGHLLPQLDHRRLQATNCRGASTACEVADQSWTAKPANELPTGIALPIDLPENVEALPEALHGAAGEGGLGIGLLEVGGHELPALVQIYLCKFLVLLATAAHHR